MGGGQRNANAALVFGTAGAAGTNTVFKLSYSL